MTRAVVNVATTPYYQRGQARLFSTLPRFMNPHYLPRAWQSLEKLGCPAHERVPYAFKAFALNEAALAADLMLWCDSSILPIRSMEPLWERIERDGYWFSANGYTNYEWTADSAYPDLFPELWQTGERSTEAVWKNMREINKVIPHVVATAFGLNVKHPKGAEFLKEYFRLASETNAFCGPWINGNNYEGGPAVGCNPRCYPCGPPDVRGHRHDQTAASVIAWRLGFSLTSPPDLFAYGKPTDTLDERTVLLADGSYT